MKVPYCHFESYNCGCNGPLIPDGFPNRRNMCSLLSISARFWHVERCRQRGAVLGAVLFLILVISLLVYWDIKIKLLTLFSFRAARRYIDRRANEMAWQLFVNARVYGGLRLIVENALGQQLPEHFMILSNHQSLVDIPFLMVVFRQHSVRFVAKKSLGKWFPAASSVLRYQRHALINRGGSFSETYRQLRRLALHSRSGVIPVVFPEGTRSKTGRVGVFHEGAARTMLQNTSIPVVTVAVDGGYQFSRLRQVVQHMRGATYRGKLLTVYPAPESKADIANIVTRAREEIIAQIASWREAERVG